MTKRRTQEVICFLLIAAGIILAIGGSYVLHERRRYDQEMAEKQAVVLSEGWGQERRRGPSRRYRRVERTLR